MDMKLEVAVCATGLACWSGGNATACLAEPELPRSRRKSLRAFLGADRSRHAQA